MDARAPEKGKILVYEPVAEAADADESLSPRPGSLNGKSVGLINNTKDFTDEIFDALGAGLEERFPEVRVRRYRKASVSGAPPELLDRVAEECEAAVCALGD